MTDGFASDDDLVNRFEREKAFIDELPADSVARFEWRLTKIRALSFIMSLEIGLDARQAALASRVLSSLLIQLTDFLYEGVEDDSITHELHPMDQIINDLVTDASEPERFEDAVGLFSPVMDRLAEFECASHEDLIHYLQNISPPTLE